MSKNTRIVGPLLGGGDRLRFSINDVVKMHRNGIARPFFTMVIEADGTATVHTNMDKVSQARELLKETLKALLDN